MILYSKLLIFVAYSLLPYLNACFFQLRCCHQEFPEISIECTSESINNNHLPNQCSNISFTCCAHEQQRLHHNAYQWSNEINNSCSKSHAANCNPYLCLKCLKICLLPMAVVNIEPHPVETINRIPNINQTAFSRRCHTIWHPPASIV